MQTSTVWIQLSNFKFCNLLQGPSILRWSYSNFHLIDQQYRNINAKLSFVAMMAISCQEGHFKDQNSHKLNQNSHKLNFKLKYEGNVPWGVSILRTWKSKIAWLSENTLCPKLIEYINQGQKVLEIDIPHDLLVFFIIFSVIKYGHQQNFKMWTQKY